MSERRQIIEDAIDDLVKSFLDYDRKEDEDLPRNAIQEAIGAGEITEAEIADRFRAQFAAELSL